MAEMNLMELALSNGIAGVMFIVWYFTFKQSNKQHQSNLEQNRKTFEHLIEIIQKDSEYKELLAGHLSEIKTELKNLKKREQRNDN